MTVDNKFTIWLFILSVSSLQQITLIFGICFVSPFPWKTVALRKQICWQQYNRYELPSGALSTVCSWLHGYAERQSRDCKVILLICVVVVLKTKSQGSSKFGMGQFLYLIFIFNILIYQCNTMPPIYFLQFTLTKPNPPK